MPPVDFQIGGANRARSFVTPTAVPTGLEALAAGVGDFAEVFAQKAQEDQLHRDSLRSVELQGQARRRLAEGMADLDPTADGYLQQAEELHSSVRADIMADPGISSRPVLEGLELDLTKLEQAGLLGAVTTRHQAIEEKGLALIDQEADGFYAQIRDDPDGYDAYTTGLADVAQQIGPSLRPDVLESKMLELGDQAIIARAEGWARQGKYDEAFAWIDATEGELSPGQQRGAKQLIHAIRTENQQAFHAETDGLIADTSIRIIDTNDQAGLNALREDVEAMASQGMFEGREQTRVSLIRAIESKRQQLVRGSQDLTVAMAEFVADRGFSSDKNADLYFEHVLAPQLAGLEPADQQKLLDQFIDRGRRVPAKIKNDIAMAEFGDNVAQLAQAAVRDQHFDLIVPGIDTGAGDRTNLVQSLMKAGFTPQAAAQLVIDQAPDAATSDRRREDYKQIVKDTEFNPHQFIVDNTEAIGRGFWGAAAAGLGLGFGFEGPTPTHIPENMASEIGAMRAEYYRLFGDEKRADDAALRFISRNYGISEVGGRPQYQRLPPERVILSDVNWEQPVRTRFLNLLSEELIEATGETVPEGDPVNGVPPYDLVTDRDTERKGHLLRVWTGVGDAMRPIWYDTPDGRRERMRVPRMTLEQMQRTRAWQTIQKESEAQLTEKRDRQAVLDAVAGVAGQLTGSALEAIAPDERTLRERHPFSGFIRRRNRKE